MPSVWEGDNDNISCQSEAIYGATGQLTRWVTFPLFLIS